MRNDLSGVYIMEKLPGDDKHHPTCFEECTPETQNKFLEKLSKEGLKTLIMQLSEALKQIGDSLNILGDEDIHQETD